MTKEGIMYNLRVGFKISLILFLTSSVLTTLIFSLFGLGISNVITDGIDKSNPELIGKIYLIMLLIIPIGWILNGYFVNKFRNWVFR